MDDKMVQIRGVKSIYSVLTPNDMCVCPCAPGGSRKVVGVAQC